MGQPDGHLAHGRAVAAGNGWRLDGIQTPHLNRPADAGRIQPGLTATDAQTRWGAIRSSPGKRSAITSASSASNAVA